MSKNRKRTDHKFLKKYLRKKRAERQNVKQKQNKKKETRHGKVFQAGRMQKKKWE